MGRHDRGALIALLGSLVAVIFVAWLSQPIKAQIAEPNSHQIENYKNSDIAHLVAAVRNFNPWEDTYAQWMMAVLGLLATIVSIWAVIEVRKSLALTREATEAATNANEQALRLFEIENRPRLKIIGVRRDGFTDEDGRETDFLCIKVKNVGGGIAKSIAIDAEHIAPKLILMGNRAVIDFANRADTGWQSEDHILFVGDRDEFIPSNPYIDETSGYAVVSIAYRGEMAPDTIYQTACAVSLNVGGGSIERGSMYAT